MFNIFSSMFYNITSGVIWLIPLPILKQLLSLFSFLCPRVEVNKTNNRKKRNRVSFESDNIRNNHYQENKNYVTDSHGITNKTYKNTKHSWNKNQVLNAIIILERWESSSNKLNKSKSLDHITYMKTQLNTQENKDHHKSTEKKKRQFVKNSNSSKCEKRQNLYRKVNHETVFLSDNEEESSDDLELLSSSDDEPFNNSNLSQVVT